MASVVIAAHNEEAVIGQCLDALLSQDLDVPLQIVVSANGCTDRTAEIARERGVVVIDRETPGKAAALNAGDDAAEGFPRIYLDADIVVPQDGIRRLVERLERGALAAVPARRLDVAGRPWPVRAYFSINQSLPAFRRGLFGRGLIAIGGEGRARFGRFPILVADDLFLDSQFADAEKAEVGEVVVTVETPFTVRDLLRRLVRVRRGNAELRSTAIEGATVRPSSRGAWLRVIAQRPRLLPAAIPYVVITLIAAIRARSRPSEGAGWGRDESTRRAARVMPR